MLPELIGILHSPDPSSFIQGLSAGTALTLATIMVTTHFRWSPEKLFSVTRQILGKRGLVGIAESVGFSLLLDSLKLPLDLVQGIHRKVQPPLSAPRAVDTRRRRQSDKPRGSEVVTLQQAFTKSVLEGKLERVVVDMSAGDSPRVTGSVTLTKEDAPWLA